MFEHRKAAGRLILAVLAAALWTLESSAPVQAKKSAGGAPAAAVQPVSNPANLPRAIYLMRHADKPASPSDPQLSAAGVTRAQRLPGYFPGLLGGQRLDYIFATAASKNSNRPVETVTPLAGSLHLPINQSYSNKSYGALAAALRSGGSYAGKTILIAWHHGNMPGLARALGATNVPSHWPNESFNMIWKLTYNADGTASLQQITEPF